MRLTYKTLESALRTITGQTAPKEFPSTVELLDWYDSNDQRRLNLRFDISEFVVSPQKFDVYGTILNPKRSSPMIKFMDQDPDFLYLIADNMLSVAKGLFVCGYVDREDAKTIIDGCDFYHGILFNAYKDKTLAAINLKSFMIDLNK
jgi:hypothetical protein